MSAPGLRLRESPRVAVAGRARLLLGTGGMTLDATVLDLSTSGMGLATAVAAPKPTVGDPCAFELAVEGVRIEGRGVVVWSRRARPDRGDAPNVGIRFQPLDGSAVRDLAAVVEPRLAAGRWSGVAEPLLAPAVAVAPIPEAPSVPAQQLTLPVAAPAVTATAVTATAVMATAVVVPPEPVEQATRPAPAPAPPPPVALPPSAPFDEPAPGAKSRAVMWIALAAAAVVVALLVWFLVGDRGESEAPVAASVGASASERTEVADVAISSDDATGDAAAKEAVVQPASVESAAMEAEAAAIAATQASLVTESVPIGSAIESATAPAGEAASRDSSRAPLASSATANDAPADAAPAAARARRVIALDHGVDGSAEVLALRFDVPFAEDDMFAALIGPDPPRYLLRLRGIERPWRPPELEVGGPLVQRVRTGLHSTPRGPELHIVIDLSTRAVEHSWTIDGDTLRVRLTPRAP